MTDLLTNREVAYELTSQLDPRVATVEVQSKRWFLKPNGEWGAEITPSTISSAQFALAFVRAYATDPKYLKKIFGSDKDLEELQEAMLEALWTAACGYLKKNTSQPWKPYLIASLREQLWKLDRRHKAGYVEGTEELSLETYLDGLVYDASAGKRGDGDWEHVSHKSLPPALIVVDKMYKAVEDFNDGRLFLDKLTEQQQIILALRREHKHRGKGDGAGYAAIAHKLGIKVREVRTELARIQRAFLVHAKKCDDVEGLAYAMGMQV